MKAEAKMKPEATMKPESKLRPESKMKNILVVFLAALREIFDESAYSRFLAKRDLVASPASYAAFQRDQEGIKARRPRCC